MSSKWSWCLLSSDVFHNIYQSGIVRWRAGLGCFVFNARYWVMQCNECGPGESDWVLPGSHQSRTWILPVHTVCRYNSTRTRIQPLLSSFITNLQCNPIAASTFIKLSTRYSIECDMWDLGEFGQTKAIKMSSEFLEDRSKVKSSVNQFDNWE